MGDLIDAQHRFPAAAGRAPAPLADALAELATAIREGDALEIDALRGLIVVAVQDSGATAARTFGPLGRGDQLRALKSTWRAIRRGECLR